MLHGETETGNGNAMFIRFGRNTTVWRRRALVNLITAATHAAGLDATKAENYFGAPDWWS
jgi:hypothetical protein